MQIWTHVIHLSPIFIDFAFSLSSSSFFCFSSSFFFCSSSLNLPSLFRSLNALMLSETKVHNNVSKIFSLTHLHMRHKILYFGTYLVQNLLFLRSPLLKSQIFQPWKYLQTRQHANAYLQPEIKVRETIKE